MNSSLFDTILNQLIGAFIAIAVSWYFYKKADLPTKTLNAKIENIQFYIIQMKLDRDLLHEYSPGISEIPRNRDVPRITRFWYSANEVVRGESVLILFRMADEGLNHDPRQMEITEMSSMLCFTASRQGYGYYVCSVTFPKNTPQGQHKINFKLADTKGNCHTQTLKITVLEK